MNSPQTPIRFASFLGDNAFGFYQRVVAYLGEAAHLPTEMVAASSDQDAMFAEGRLDAAFSCGLPYVSEADGTSLPVQLLAAPVMPDARYADRPVYFSDIIVRRDSRHQSLEDLRGATFSYNEAASFSGYVLPRYHLMTIGESLGFFGRAVASGSHAASMDWVESGTADAAAIDSVVLDMEFAQRPQRRRAFRVVASLGPAGMPPVIASSRVPREVCGRLTRALIDMHRSERGLAILTQGGVRRFAPVTDRNYDDIRQMLRALKDAGVGVHG